MIVCICKAVSDRHIRGAAERGVVTLRELSRQLGVGTCCGKCVPQARELLTACAPARPAQGRAEPPVATPVQVAGGPGMQLRIARKSS